MSALQVSDALLRTLARKSPADPALIDGYLAGTIPTKPATVAGWFKPIRFPPGYGPHGEHGRQKRVRDRAASLGRKRTIGGSGAMPHTLRCHYTEGERAALSVIALEVKRRGFCDWPIDRIAAAAGVSRRTVQYAIASATAAGRQHVKVTYRPLRGRRNATNIVTIIATEWLAWLKRGPSLASIERAIDRIGCKGVHGSKKGSFYPEKKEGAGARLSGISPGRSAGGLGRRSDAEARRSDLVPMPPDASGGIAVVGSVPFALCEGGAR